MLIESPLSLVPLYQECVGEIGFDRLCEPISRETLKPPFLVMGHGL